MIQSLTAKIIICQNTGFAGVVARVESLPLASLGDFVRGRMSEAGNVLLRELQSPTGENCPLFGWTLTMPLLDRVFERELR